MFRPRNLRSLTSASDSGFTLLEALAALTVVAISLGALSALTHSTVLSAMFTEHRVALIQTARKVFTALPPRAALSPGDISGDLDGSRWRIKTRPYLESPAAGGAWDPELVAIEVRGPTGALLEFSTVRIRQRGGS